VPTTWETLYQSDLLGVYGLIAVPLVVLLCLLAAGRPHGAPGAEPRAAGFVHAWAIVFALETILDPLLTGPALAWLGLAGGSVASVAMIPFVLIGDLRVYLLVLGVADPDRGLRPTLQEALAWMVVVPAAAGSLTAVLKAGVDGLPPTTIWIVYEAMFAALALGLRARLVPARVSADRPGVRAYLRAVLAYVAVYYALWVTADVLVLAGSDVAWLLRIVANQLYYALWIPFAYGLFFSRWYASTSRSTQAAR
jgi:hypothetical protein